MRKQTRLKMKQTKIEEPVKGNQPEKKFRAGAIAATIWKNNVEKEGKTFEFKTVSLERNYKDKNDEWQTTSTLRLNDVPKAVLVLSKAYEYLALKEQDVHEEMVELKL